MQALCYRAIAELEEGGDLLLAVAAQVVEHGHRALARGQRPDERQERLAVLAVLERGLRVAGRRDLAGGLERHEDEVAAAAQAVALRVHDGSEPAREGRRVAQLIELFPSGDEGFLRRLLGEAEVPEGRVGTGVGKV